LFAAAINFPAKVLKIENQSELDAGNDFPADVLQIEQLELDEDNSSSLTRLSL
jgi:hypothetical protein